MSVNRNLRDYLRTADGCVSRTGWALSELARKTGYSMEMLRSIALGRRGREPARCGEKMERLRAELSRLGYTDGEA